MVGWIYLIEFLLISGKNKHKSETLLILLIYLAFHWIYGEYTGRRFPVSPFLKIATEMHYSKNVIKC